MKGFAILLLAGLAICGWFIFRLWRRPAPPPVLSALPAVDAWQKSIRIDLRTDYTEPHWAALKREEARQRPQEGRN